ARSPPRPIARTESVRQRRAHAGAIDRPDSSEYIAEWASKASARRSLVGLVRMDRQSAMPEVDIAHRVRAAGLRPTRQRVALAKLLFAKGDRHLSAEELHEEALGAGVTVSLATVYIALRQFTVAGLLRIVAVEGVRTYFDTNTSDHHHFYIEEENRVVDIDSGPVTVSNLPEPPEGMEIANVDIIVRLRRRRSA